jgi:CCR4-NOT transcriptional complex subunit CAF120
MRRSLTPIREASGSEKDASRLPTVEAPVLTSPQLGDGTSANTTVAPRPSTEQREEPDVPSSAQMPPSMYTPIETGSVPGPPPHEKPEVSAISTGIQKPSPEAGTSLTSGGPNGQPSYDDSRTLDVNQASSPRSARSLHSSAASPPSLSPANSSNPPASHSPAQALPRTPSPKFSILTSPHSLDSPARPNYAESLGLKPLTPPTVFGAASLEPTKSMQDSVQASTDSSPNGTHAIYDEAGALYYLHQSGHDSFDANVAETAREEDVDFPARTHASQYVIVPLRPKTASPPPPTASSAGHLSIDTSHRKPPIQPLPRTPTLDYGLGLVERRPAGARAAPVSNNHRQDSLSGSSVSAHPQPQRNLSTRIVHQENISQMEDPDADAFAALTFLEQHGDDTSAAPAPAPSGPSTSASLPSFQREGPPTISEPHNVLPPTPEGENTSVYRSSFAPSKNARERKARTEAQQAAHEAATHRPGRGTGKPKDKLKTVGTWGDSSEDEEEEEEEEEDDDVDSDGQPVALRDDRSASNYTASVNQRSLVSSPRGPSPLTSGVDAPPPLQPIPRPPRNLPPVPVPRGQGMSPTLPTLNALVLMFSVV